MALFELIQRSRRLRCLYGCVSAGHTPPARSVWRWANRCANFLASFFAVCAGDGSLSVVVILYIVKFDRNRPQIITAEIPDSLVSVLRSGYTKLLVAERSHSYRAPPCARMRRRQTAAAMGHDAEAWLRRLWWYLASQT